MEGRGTLPCQSSRGRRAHSRWPARPFLSRKLRRLIRPSGFFTRKAPALKAFVNLLDEEFGGSLEASPQRPRLRCASAFWLCPASAPRPPMRSCSTRSVIRFPWPMSISAALPSGTGFLRQLSGRSRISYDALADLTRQRLRRRSRAQPCAALQRVSRAHRGRGQGTLRPHRPMRRLPACRRSSSAAE